MKTIKLGTKVIDKITGFEGIVTGHARYLTGCDQYCVQPKCEKDMGKYPEASWFDEGRIKVIKKVMSKKDVAGKKNGSDYSAPIK